MMNLAVITVTKRCQQKQKRARFGRLFAIPFWHSLSFSSWCYLCFSNLRNIISPDWKAVSRNGWRLFAFCVRSLMKSDRRFLIFQIQSHVLLRIVVTVTKPALNRLLRVRFLHPQLCTVIHMAWKRIANPFLAGSIPARCLCACSQAVWQPAFNRCIGGSSPPMRSNGLSPSGKARDFDSRTRGSKSRQLSLHLVG